MLSHVQIMAGIFGRKDRQYLESIEFFEWRAIRFRHWYLDRSVKAKGPKGGLSGGLLAEEEVVVVASWLRE